VRNDSHFNAEQWGSPRFGQALRCLVPALLAVTVLTVVASAPAVARTPRIKKPGAPTGVLASPISGGASISWTPPASDGGAPITGYTVTARMEVRPAQRVVPPPAR